MKITRYLIIAALFFIALLFLYIRANVAESNYQFSGIVEKVTCSDKKTPCVLIKGIMYFVTYPKADFNQQIEKGDSLTKEKKSRIYKLIKLKTREVVFSK